MTENEKLNKILAVCDWRFSNHYNAKGGNEWDNLAATIVPGAKPDNPLFLSYVKRLEDDKYIENAPDIPTDKIATNKGHIFHLNGGYVYEASFKYKLSNWFKEPDTWWKILTFIFSPIFGVIVGYFSYKWLHNT